MDLYVLDPSWQRGKVYMHRTVYPSAAKIGSGSPSYKSGRLSRIEGRPRILVVDEEPVTANALAEILRRNGYATETACNATGALQRTLLSTPDLVITDVALPGMTGVQLAVTIKRAYPDCKILLCSGQAYTPELIRSPHWAPYDFTLLSKPVRPRDLLALVEHRLGMGGPVTGADQAVFVPAAA
jgi:DNA-binding NtrC family response regulator